MDLDIVEIPPPIHHLKKQKRAILHDVIDIDDDDDSEDLVIIGEKVSESNMGKTIEAIHQVVEVSDYTFCQPGVENFGPVSGIESSNGYPLVSHNLVNVDGHGSDEAHLDNVEIPPGTEAPFTWLPEYDLGLKKSTFKNSPWYDTQSDPKNSHVTDSSQPSWSLEPGNSKIQGSTVGSSNLQIKMYNVDHSSGTELSSPQLFYQAVPSKKKSAASQRSGRGLNISLGVQSSKSKRFLKSFHSKMKSASFGSKNHGWAGNPEPRKLLHAGKPPAATKFKSAKKAAGNSCLYHANIEANIEGEILRNFQSFKQLNSKDEILRKFRNFKQFDAVSDTSDHHFICKNSSMKKHPKKWAKEIQKEWKILEKDLPDSIFVRLYESRMDLLRAVIIGVEGTPYHDGLFFFDVYFPSGCPDEPPVLVSMQGLVLNRKPFFNKPGCESDTSAYAENMSLKYNEDTFIQSLRAMMDMIRRPPKNFEDFVVGHFISRAHDILVACNAYMEGAQVGCLVKGGVQDVDEGDRSCSKGFKNSLAGYMSVLVLVFSSIGAKDCEKFLSAAKKAYEIASSVKTQSLATSTTGRYVIDKIFSS